MNDNKYDLEELFDKIKLHYSDDPEVLYELTDIEDSINGFTVQVFSTEGIIYSSRNMPHIANENKFEKSLIDSYLQLDFSENPTAIAVAKNQYEEHMLFLRGKLYYNSEPRFVIISKPIQSIDESIDIFTESNIIISFIVLVAGFFLIFIIAKQISSPIKNIEYVSGALSKLDFSCYANENTSIKEISSLAKSINSMSSQLKKNMTELQLANIKLTEDVEYQKKLENNRKQFIANISHEMKTPLALLQLYCENLKSDIVDIDKDEYIKTIVDETKRLDQIVKAMINVSSIENGLAKVRKEQFNLSDSVKSITEQMMPMLSEFNLILNVEPQLHIIADKNQVEEAIRNYINNAISHTKTGGIVSVTLKNDNHSAHLSVYNSGERISHNDIENIWNSFFKSDKARTRNASRNAGLGLYIVKLVCENNNGTYGVKNVENGVEFSLIFDLS